jgi:hypothetical protein
VQSVLPEDGMAPVNLVIGRDVERVVERGDYNQEPREGGKGLVGQNGLFRVRFVLCERVDLMTG